MKNPPLFDIDGTPSLFDVSRSSMASELGSNYFGSFSAPGETVAGTFDRIRTGATLVYPAVLNRQGMDLDEALLLDLNIKKDSGMTASDAVSRFFNSGCSEKFGGIQGL